MVSCPFNIYQKLNRKGIKSIILYCDCVYRSCRSNILRPQGEYAETSRAEGLNEVTYIPADREPVYRSFHQCHLSLLLMWTFPLFLALRTWYDNAWHGATFFVAYGSFSRSGSSILPRFLAGFCRSWPLVVPLQ